MALLWVGNEGAAECCMRKQFGQHPLLSVGVGVPCYRSNVWRLGAAPDGDVDISCSDWAACHPLSTDTLYDIIDMIDGAAARVRDGRMPKARLAELETGFGLNFSSRGVLFDRPLLQELNILCTLRTDWMHGELQHGSMADELQGFLLLK